jgi:hypothetical protein
MIRRGPKGSVHQDVLPKTPPVCPKCGAVAVEKPTRYGPRSECCGLWSWNRKPLVDGETHAARRKAVEDLRSLHEGGAFDKVSAYAEVAKRTNRVGKVIAISTMTAKEATGVSEAVTDIFLDVLTGTIKAVKNKRRR